MTETLSVQALNRATLARQMLLSREPVPVAEAVGRLCGMQAQEPKPPFLGLWTRLEGFQAADLHSAFNDRSIVRATMMRATLHLMTAADYTAFRTTLQPMLDGALRVLGDRAKGLDLQKVVPAARSLLQEAPLTFNEVRASLQEMFPDVNDRALGYAARLCVPLVMIPTQDRWGFPRTAQFTLADSWLGSVAAGEPAVEELMLRYLAAYGPASAADAQTWSGLQSTGEALERLRPRLRVFADDKDRELFDLPDAPRPGEDVQAPPGSCLNSTASSLRTPTAGASSPTHTARCSRPRICACAPSSCGTASPGASGRRSTSARSRPCGCVRSNHFPRRPSTS
ncbi:winged helix DNA-binding domain-containing protein [Actinomadura madurae]|nr:winged helix DNA-binding domain-containing protein [Actinomadura madurae]MCP9985093.1 winged helix DNA-binding domain-containing protein [Actinomadura madurae]